MRLQDDSAYQQLLNALNTCAEHALPSLLQTITRWYDTQHSSGASYRFRRTTNTANKDHIPQSPKNQSGRSQTLSALTGAPTANQLAGGDCRDQLIRSMHVDAGPVNGNDTSLLNTPSLPIAAAMEHSPSWPQLSNSAREIMAERRDVCLYFRS